VKLSPSPSFTPCFVTKLFVFKQGRANPPHAHDTMVSMHHILRGRLRIRHFARVRDEPCGFVLRPTTDRRLGLGEGTSISGAGDSVHWPVHGADMGIGPSTLLETLRIPRPHPLWTA
jgi:hypothetical protein